MKQLLTVAETKALTGLSQGTLFRIAAGNRWPEAAVRIPGSRSIRFRRSVVERYIGQVADQPQTAA